MQSKLVSYTVINAVPPWMTLLNPNLRTGSPGGDRGAFDVWPEDQAPSMRDLDSFAAAARGWLTFCAMKGDRSTELAVRRTAACFGIAGVRFGVEDRLIDVGIALEAMYGPFGCGAITRKTSSRAAWLLGESSGRRLRDLQGDEIVLHGALQRLSTEPSAGIVRNGRSRVGRRSQVGTRTRSPYAIRLLARGPVNDEDEWDALMQEGPTGASDQ